MANSPKLITPRGTAVWPKLIRPDTKYNALGTYECKVALDSTEHKDFIAKLSKIYEDHVGTAPNKLKNNMFYKQTDSEGELTGNTVLRLIVKNRPGKKKGEVWDRQPAQADAKGRNIPADSYVDVGNGSTVRVGFEAYCWKNPNDGSKGVSLQPSLVQIIDYQEKTGDPSAGFELDEEDGSFEADVATIADYEDDGEEGSVSGDF